jgi:preprotein translocase subunit YajC
VKEVLKVVFWIVVLVLMCVEMHYDQQKKQKRIQQEILKGDHVGASGPA